MKKTFLILFFTLAYTASNAQKDFQGMAVYESKTSMSDFKARFEGNKNITPDMQKMMEERMKKMFEKTFVLNFDKSASIYKEEEKLDTPGAAGGGMMMRFGNGGTLYKNIKEKRFVTDRDLMGKEFLIKDTLTTIRWQMTQETKQIGDYLCFKATALVPNPSFSFREIRDKAQKELEKNQTAEEAKNKTNLLPEIKKDIGSVS